MTEESVEGDDAEFNKLFEKVVDRHRRGERAGLREYIDRPPTVAGQARESAPARPELGPVGRAIGGPDTSPSSPGFRRAPWDQLGDYRILREIGRGGMGVVYKAEQLSLGRRVALKVLPRTMEQDANAQMRFRREARSAARLHHTNIVPVFEVGQDGDVIYYAMQFIQGPGLDMVVEELKRLRDRSRGPGGRDRRARGDGASDPATQGPSAADGPDRATSPPTEALPSAPRAGSSERMARSLLAGQFNRIAARPESGVAGARDPRASDDPEDREAPPDRDRTEATEDPAPPEDRAPSTPGSTAMSGWARLSNVDPSGRRQPFFRSVAEIGRQAAAGLAHAHGRGIVHRDIKPSNLLLDAAGIVWITDFGLAKGGDETLTASGDILGTLRYMAPERFRGEGDARADIYALGITLYELLTLRPTFESPDRFRLIELVRDQEPPRPRSLDLRIPRDLETIVLKAIEKDPRRRYASAVEMGEDLRRFLDGEPIKARQVGELEKAWKWARRRPAIAGLILLAAGSMLAGTALAAAFGLRANDRARDASRAEARSKESERDATLAREQAIVERDHSRRLSAGLAFDRGLALAEEGRADRGLHWMLEGLKTAPEGERDFRLMIRRNLASWLPTIHEPRKIIEQGGVETDNLPVKFSPDGRTFITSSMKIDDDEAPVSLWDSATGRPLAVYPEAVAPASFRPDGKVLLVGWKDQRHLRAIDLATGLPLWTTPELGSSLINVVFLAEDELLVILRRNSQSPDECQVWDASSGRPLRGPWKGQGGLAPDGRVLVAEGQGDGQTILSLLDPGGGGRADVFRLAGKKLREATFSPDMKTLWVSAYESYAYRAARTSGRLWDLATRRPIGPVLDKTTSLSFLPAGDRALTLTDGAIALRDQATGGALGPALREVGTISYYDRGPDGRAVVTRTDRGTTQLWRLSADAMTATPARKAGGEMSDAIDPRRDRLTRVVDPHPRLARGGRASIRWLTDQGNRALIQVVDPIDGRTIGRPARHRFSTVRSFCFSPDGRTFATGSYPANQAGEVGLWDVATGLPLFPPMPHSNYVCALAFRPDGRLLAAGDYNGLVRFWDTATGREVGRPLGQGAIVWSLAFSPDGKTLAVGHHFEHAGKPGVLLWDVERRRRIGDLMRCQNAVYDLTFRPDGGAVVAAVRSGLWFWDAATGRAIGEAIAGEASPAFHPDGKTFVTAGADGSVRLRDASTGAALATLLSGPSPARRLAYRDDGRLIVAGFEDGSVRLIDPATSRQVGPPRSLRSPVADLAFRDDGRSFVAVDELGESRAWPVPGEPEAEGPGELALRIEARTGYRMTTGPAVVPLDSKSWSDRIDRVARLDGPPSLEVDLSWHDPMAREAEEEGNCFAALWHLDRLIAARPGDWTLFARRARVRSSSDAFEQASADYERAARLAPAGAIPDWQAQCAVRAKEAGRWLEALWYLDRLVVARPDDWTLLDDRSAVHDRLGHAAERAADHDRALELGGDAKLVVSAAEGLARAGRWREAAALLARCGRRGPLDLELAQAWSLASLIEGDRAGYLEARAALIARVAEVPKLAVTLLGLASILAQGADESGDAGPVGRWVDSWRSAWSPGQDRDYYHALCNLSGGLHLRAGRLDEAIARLGEGVAIVGESIPTDWAFLAQAHARKGDLASARRDLERLRASKPAAGPMSFWDIQEIELLRREAESLILDRTFPASPFTP